MFLNDVSLFLLIFKKYLLSLFYSLCRTFKFFPCIYKYKLFIKRGYYENQ